MKDKKRSKRCKHNNEEFLLKPRFIDSPEELYKTHNKELYEAKLTSKKQIKKLKYIGSYFDKNKKCHVHIFKRFRKVYRLESISYEGLEQIREVLPLTGFRVIDTNHKYLFDLELIHGIL